METSKNKIQIIKKGELYSFKNLEGELITPFKYNNARGFSEGLAAVETDGKWGYINETGEEVIPLQYDVARGFNDKLTSVELNKKWGFINKKGEKITPIQYDLAKNFSEGLARVKKEGKWGLINQEGIEVTPTHYENIDSFVEGLAVVRKDIKWGFINREGKEAIAAQYDWVLNFSEGLASVKKNGKWGFINQDGEVIIPLQYQVAKSFKGGLSLVKQEGKYKQINIEGKEVAEGVKQYRHNFLYEIKDIIANDLELRRLDKITSKKIIRITADSGYIIISASKESETENRQNYEALLQLVKNSGYCFIPIYASYTESDKSKNSISLYEKSFILLNFDRKNKKIDFNELHNKGLEWTAKFNQDVFLSKVEHSIPEYVKPSGEIEKKLSSDSMIYEVAEEFLTDLIKSKYKNKGSFIFEGIFVNPGPVTITERMSRDYSNEIFIG